MRNTAAIAWKETKAYFTTPTAYVVSAMFLVLTGIFFVNDITAPFAEATVRGFINWASFFTLFLAPLLTMRLLSEEQKLGTLELLLTAPVRDWEVVIGKYAAALSLYVVIMVMTLYYVILLYWFGDPDGGPIYSAYLGVFLHGSAALAVGLMASSLTGNQIVSAAVGTAVLLTLSFIDEVADLVSGTTQDVLLGFSMNDHLLDFRRGIIDTSNIAYYVSIAAVFLFLTIRSLETRRWR
jgi:ABC-2 type transport system permease protein